MIVFQENPQLKIAYSEVDYDHSNDILILLKKQGINLDGLDEIRQESRKTEWMFIRKILNEIHHKAEIIYDDHGKPHFKNSDQHVSISHSNKMVAISIHNQLPTGIDIQHITDKVVRIKSKFLSNFELNKVSSDPVELCYYWSCKEALFKVYGKKDAFLKENFKIESMHWDSHGGSATGLIHTDLIKQEHTLKMIRIGNYVMAYVVNY